MTLTTQRCKSSVVILQKKDNLTWLIFEGVAGDASITDMGGIPFQGKRVQVGVGDYQGSWRPRHCKKHINHETLCEFVRVKLKYRSYKMILWMEWMKLSESESRAFEDFRVSLVLVFILKTRDFSHSSFIWMFDLHCAEGCWTRKDCFYIQEFLCTQSGFLYATYIGVMLTLSPSVLKHCCFHSTRFMRVLNYGLKCFVFMLLHLECNHMFLCLPDFILILSYYTHMCLYAFLYMQMSVSVKDFVAKTWFIYIKKTWNLYHWHLGIVGRLPSWSVFLTVI